MIRKGYDEIFDKAVEVNPSSFIKGVGVSPYDNAWGRIFPCSVDSRKGLYPIKLYAFKGGVKWR